jgi:hypothetical protein
MTQLILPTVPTHAAHPLLNLHLPSDTDAITISISPYLLQTSIAAILLHTSELVGILSMD